VWSAAGRTGRGGGGWPGVVADGAEERGRQKNPPRPDPGRGAAPSRPPAGNPRKPPRDQDREEKQVVAVRQRLQQPRHAEQRQPSPAAVLVVRVEREERDGHPPRDEQVQVREL